MAVKSGTKSGIKSGIKPKKDFFIYIYFEYSHVMNERGHPYQWIWTSVYRVRVRHIHMHVHMYVSVELCRVSNNKPNETFY